MNAKWFLLAGVLLCLDQSASAALVARWTFNAGSAADLNSDVGTFAFTEFAAGSNATTTYNGDGSVTLGSGRELSAAGINSTTLTTLTSNSTIFMRVRLDGDLQDFSPFAGFTQTVGPGLVTELAMVAQKVSDASATSTNIGFAAETATGTGFGPASGFPVTTNGTWFDLALVTSAGATQQSVTMYVNGNAITRTGAGIPLGTIADLALGRLQSNRALNASVSFDEVRVYDETLSAQAISEIVVVPVPEPGSLALLGMGGLMIAARRRK